jgi:hypothetical protein
MRKIARVMPILVLIGVLALVPALTAFAQGGGTNPLCGGLSASDCEILTGAQTTLAGVTSFSLPSFSLSFSMTTAKETVAMDAKGSAEIAMASQTDFTLHLVIDEASITSKGQTQPLAAEIILTPTKGFVKMNGEWYGQDITPEDINSLGLGSLSDLMGGAQTGTSGMGDMSAMMSGLDLGTSVTTTRGEDAEVGGAKVAVFTTNIDLANLIVTLVSSPAVGQMLGMAAGETGTAMTPADLQMISAFVQPMLAGTTIGVELSVNPDDGVIHALKVDMVIAVDASMLSPEVGKIAGEVHVAAEIANVNQPVEVTLPESFKPMEELQPTIDALQSSLGM